MWSFTTTSTTYITADGRKVRKVRKKKVTIEDGSFDSSRRESEVEISEISTTLNLDSSRFNNPNTNAISDGKEVIVLISFSI